MPPFFFCGNLFDEYLLRLPLDRECNIKIDDILAAAHRVQISPERCEDFVSDGVSISV